MLIGHLIQVGILMGCVYLAAASRRALNGFARSLIVLLLLFILHGFNDAFGFMDDAGNLVLTSLVVLLITIDLYAVYRQRDLYAQWADKRKQKIDELENLRKASEARASWDNDLPARWL